MLSWLPSLGFPPAAGAAAFFLAAIAISLTLLIIYSRWHYGSLESAGFATVPPHFIFGSDPHSYKKPIQEQDVEWARAYGPVFGAYEGRSPHVYVTDPELVRQIFVRDSSDYFYDRRRLETGVPTLDEQLDFMPGEKWKRMRGAITPLFTAARIRAFSGVLGRLADEYMADLRQSTAATKARAMRMNPREFVIPILVEMTAQCFLGISVEDRKNPDNEMIRLLKRLAFEDFRPDFTNTTLLQTFPFLRRFWAPSIFRHAVRGLGRLTRILEHLIATRSKNQIPVANAAGDLVDVLVTMTQRLESLEYRRLKVTRETVMTRGWSIFIPGYETMALVFTMCAYHFAKNPHVQERAAAEVDKLYAKLEETPDAALDAPTLASELPFLSACIQEVLRLHPAFSRPERMCGRDWTSDETRAGRRVHVKKGMNVVLLTWAANRNPDFYTEPDRFFPERWLPQHRDSIHPFAFTSFGFGHRNCVGQRLGVFVPKLIMCRFLKEFRFRDRADTVAKLRPGFPALVRYEPFCLDVVLRTELDENWV